MAAPLAAVPVGWSETPPEHRVCVGSACSLGRPQRPDGRGGPWCRGARFWGGLGHVLIRQEMPKSRAMYRIAATRTMMAGARMRRANEKTEQRQVCRRALAPVPLPIQGP